MTVGTRVTTAGAEPTRYQDARGVRAHLPLLRAYGVRGTGLWALGFKDPDVRAALRGE